MSTLAQREAYDRMMTEPHDNSIEEGRIDAEIESAIRSFGDTGKLPDGRMLAGDVDDELADRWPDALHALSQASTDDEVLDLVKRIIALRNEIAEEMITEAVMKKEAA